MGSGRPRSSSPAALRITSASPSRLTSSGGCSARAAGHPLNSPAGRHFELQLFRAFQRLSRTWKAHPPPWAAGRHRPTARRWRASPHRLAQGELQMPTPEQALLADLTAAAPEQRRRMADAEGLQALQLLPELRRDLVELYEGFGSTRRRPPSCFSQVSALAFSRSCRGVSRSARTVKPTGGGWPPWRSNRSLQACSAASTANPRGAERGA